MKKVLLYLLSIFIISCSNNSTKKTLNDISEMGFQGKVKTYESKSYEVTGYEFGQPVYDLYFTYKNNYNEYGFIVDGMSNYESEYYNSLFRENLEYSNPVLGLISKREYESVRDEKKDSYTQSFKYDSISNKLIQRKTLNIETNTSELTNINYESGEVRITRYDDSSNELKGIRIEKLDDKENLISSTEYDKDGKALDETYILKLKNGVSKDSTINRFQDGDIYYIGVRTFDKHLREIKYIRYDEDEVDGYIKEYDNDNKNSSYTKQEFSGLQEVIIKKFKVQITLDEAGNIVEELTMNLDNNQIESKIVKNYTYYN